MKTPVLLTALALTMLTLATAPVSASEDCDMNGDICVSANTGGACAMVWAVYHNTGACVDVKGHSVTVCKMTPPCITVG